MKSIIFIAIIIRLTTWLVFELVYHEASFPHFDSYEYYYNSENLTVWEEAREKLGYENWYERTPAYTLFLYLTDRILFIQILISALGVFLMYRMNKIAGWIWCFYPMDIIHSFQYMKETLLIFIIISIIYAFKKYDYILPDYANNAFIR
jgi:hypothetical protein